MIEGRCWLFGDDINTDVMMPGDVLYSSEETQTKALFRDTRPGWLEEIRTGDIVVAGRNFGVGSSRPAARSLVSAGIAVLVAESINGLFLRNCVSYGLIAMTCPDIRNHVGEGDILQAEPQTGHIRNLTTGISLRADPVPINLLNIMRAGGTLPMLEAQGLISKSENR